MDKTFIMAVSCQPILSSFFSAQGQKQNLRLKARLEKGNCNSPTKWLARKKAIRAGFYVDLEKTQGKTI